ncbi:MAG: OmpA family protein [Lentimicrobium sp.]|nr:OmpA family protein [Lentimicrobium sp.]
MMYQRFLLFLAILAFTFQLSAQNKPEGKEARFHQKALDYYNASAYDKALDEIGKVFKINDKYIESWLLAGDIYAIKGNAREAIRCYQTAVEIDHQFFPPAVYILANLQFQEKLYADCISNYEWYLQYPKARQTEKNKSIKNLALARFRLDAMQHPEDLHPVNLGENVNTSGYEFVNYISPDAVFLYFTRRMTTGEKRDEDFYFAEKLTDSTWQAAVSLGDPVNTPGDEGAMCISPDGQWLFFSACNRPDGYGSCDIYASKREGKHWGQPQNLGKNVNTSYWETQPSFSSDGKSLYFVSNRPGGFGSSDIWVSRLDSAGSWLLPENLGNVVNTAESERGPFIHPDGQSLYFSSKGHPGMGEGDIFMTTPDNTGHWTEPVNVGFPLNTEADEVTFIVDNQGKYAYVSSETENGFGLQDIYRVLVPEKVKPWPVTYMKGVVSDSLSGRLLSASFVLSDIATGRVMVQSQSDPVNGSFLLCIPAGKKYALSVEKSGYLFYSAHFEPDSDGSLYDPIVKNVLLKPVREGESIVLRNIFFETDSSRLLPVSETELNRLYQLLVHNSGLRIEISGHTDNTGSETYNRNLSEKRAFEVYNYLIKKGIDVSRLSYKGCGAMQPVADNSTPEGKALNRRTEFKVLGIQ